MPPPTTPITSPPPTVSRSADDSDDKAIITTEDDCCTAPKPTFRLTTLLNRTSTASCYHYRSCSSCDSFIDFLKVPSPALTSAEANPTCLPNEQQSVANNINPLNATYQWAPVQNPVLPPSTHPSKADPVLFPLSQQPRPSSTIIPRYTPYPLTRRPTPPRLFTPTHPAPFIRPTHPLTTALPLTTPSSRRPSCTVSHHPPPSPNSHAHRPNAWPRPRPRPRPQPQPHPQTHTQARRKASPSLAATLLPASASAVSSYYYHSSSSNSNNNSNSNSNTNATMPTRPPPLLHCPCNVPVSLRTVPGPRGWGWQQAWMCGAGRCGFFLFADSQAEADGLAMTVMVEQEGGKGDDGEHGGVVGVGLGMRGLGGIEGMERMIEGAWE